MARSPVIDADGHILERSQDVWRYIEPPFDKRGGGLWQGGHPWDAELAGTLTNHDYKDGGLEPERQVDTWLRIADRENIETAVLFPTGSGHVAYIPEPAWAVAVSRATNTHFATDYGAASPRLRPVGVLPMRDPQAAAEELRRAVTELGLVSFEILSQGLTMGFGDPFYDPIFAEAERLGVPLCIHGTRSKPGGGRRRTVQDVRRGAHLRVPGVRHPALREHHGERGARALPEAEARLPRDRCDVATLLAGPAGRALGTPWRARDARTSRNGQRTSSASTRST